MYEPGTEIFESQKYGTITLGSGKKSRTFDYGRTYLVYEERVFKALQIFSEFIYLGNKVLCISRTHPDLIRERWPGKMVECIWLSERPGERNVAPNQLSNLVQKSAIFAENNGNAVILLDGMEYLGLFNDSNRMQIFIEHIHDLMMETASILIMAIDPRLFEPRSLARLRRNAEVVE